MNINTWSILLSFSFAMLTFLIGMRFLSGPLKFEDIIISLFLFLPFFVIIFTSFYIYISHLLNRYKDTKYIQPLLNKTRLQIETTDEVYSLPIIYRVLGIIFLLSIGALVLVKISFVIIALVLLLFSFFLKTPYKFKVEGESLIIYSVLGKTDMKISEVKGIKMGLINNRVDSADKYFYLNHFVTNANLLTNQIADRIGSQNIEQIAKPKFKKGSETPSFWAFKTVLILLASLLSSILGVLYLIKNIRQINF